MKRSDIEITCNAEDLILFKTTCSCGSDNHNLDVCVEKFNQPPNSNPSVSLFYKVSWRDKGNFFQKIIRRIKIAYNVLKTGYIDMDEEFLFRDTGHLRSFIIALLEAKREIARDEQKEEQFNQFIVDVLKIKK